MSFAQQWSFSDSERGRAEQQSRVEPVTDCPSQHDEMMGDWMEMAWGAHTTLDSSNIHEEVSFINLDSRIFGSNKIICGSVKLSLFSFHTR